MNYYKFANLNVTIDCDDRYFKGIAAEYEVSMPENCDIIIKMSKKAEIQKPDCAKIGEMPYPLAQLSWYTNGDYMYMAGYNAPTDEYVFCAEIDKAYKNIEISLLDIKADVDDTLYARNVLDLVMRFVVVKHNCINIHSSSIAYNNNGILFSAPSGTGKSTHTGLWKKCYPETVVINDDLPLITVGDEIMISGTPWCGTSGINHNMTVPLKAVVFLRRGEENSIERVNAAMSMRYLIDEVFKTPVAETASKQLDLIGEILGRVPAYILKCNISDEAVETVKRECGF